MNYWLSPTGRVFETLVHGGHYALALKIIDELEPGLRKECDFDEVEYLEELGWIRYCDWGNREWVIPIAHTPTRRQKERAFELTHSFI